MKKKETRKHAHEALIFDGDTHDLLTRSDVHSMSRRELENLVLELRKNVIVREDKAGRKRAEEASDYRIYQVIALEAAGMVTWEWDIPTRSIRYSKNISDVVGGTAVDRYCSLDTLMPVIHPEDRERLALRLDQTSKTGDPWECEYRVRMLDGTYRWIFGKGRHVVFKDGKPVRVLGISMDITERKRIEEALREARDNLEIRVKQRTSELEQTNRALLREITERKRAEDALYCSQQMLHTVLDTIPVAVFWKDHDSHYLGGNCTWLAIAGFKTSEEAVGKSDYDLPWEREQADSFRKDDRKVMESGTGEYNIIEPYMRADGTRAWAKTNKVPLRDAEGNIIGVLGTFEDITELKQAEETLRESEERFVQSAVQSHTVTWEVNADGLYTYVSPVIERVFGYQPEEIIGKCHFYDLHPEKGDEMRSKCGGKGGRKKTGEREQNKNTEGNVRVVLF